MFSHTITELPNHDLMKSGDDEILDKASGKFNPALDLLRACQMVASNARIVERGMLRGSVEIRLTQAQYETIKSAISKATQ